MEHKIDIIKILFVLFILHIPSHSLAQSDSLVDCFPLSVGNQWIYHSNKFVPTSEFSVVIDTGIIAYTIVEKTDFPDSILWSFKEHRNLHRISYFAGTVTADSIINDSTFFDFVEIKLGNHELYRRLNQLHPEYINDGLLWNSVIPFLPDMPDTSRLYRYHLVDSTQIDLFSITYKAYGTEYVVILKSNIGLQSLSVSSLGTWEGPPNVSYELRSQVITAVREHPFTSAPSAISLMQNYPNPFNPNTTIEFSLPDAEYVSLVIYNVLGQEVSELVSHQMNAGRHSAEWNASRFPSGIYYYRLKAGSFSETKKLVLLK